MVFDILIENGLIVTCDAGGRVVEEGWLGVLGDRIVWLDAAPPPANAVAAKRLGATGFLVMPGFVNAHTHAAMTLFRGLADDLPLMTWLDNYIFPVERNMDAEFVRTGSLLACAEMILSGTTTFSDMYLFEEEVAKAARQAGMRCLVGEVLYDFPSPNYGSVANGLAYTEDLIDKWQSDPLVHVAVEPHSPYTCSPDLLRRANEISLRRGVPLITHLAETRAECLETERRFGKRPVAHLESLGLLGPHLLAAHAIHLDEPEIEQIARSGAKVVHNPQSNMKLASGIAPVPRLLDNGVTVGLGTDGCASNNNLDMLEEMDTAAKLHKVGQMDPTVMSAESVLRMATYGGATALGLDKEIGSLETGKKADIIMINLAQPHLTPLYNVFSQLVYAARGDDVYHVIINGRLVMENRELLTLDPVETMMKARKTAERVWTWVGGRRR